MNLKIFAHHRVYATFYFFFLSNVKNLSQTQPKSGKNKENFSEKSFTLISKMYKFVCLSCEFFELWPFKGQKRPVFPQILKNGPFSTFKHNSFYHFGTCCTFDGEPFLQYFIKSMLRIISRFLNITFLQI